MEQQNNDVVVFFDQTQVEGNETIEEVVECDESSSGILCTQCNTTFTSLTEHIETFHMGQKTNLEVVNNTSNYSERTNNKIEHKLQSGNTQAEVMAALNLSYNSQHPQNDAANITSQNTAPEITVNLSNSYNSHHLQNNAGDVTSQNSAPESAEQGISEDGETNLVDKTGLEYIRRVVKIKRFWEAPKCKRLKTTGPNRAQIAQVSRSNVQLVLLNNDTEESVTSNATLSVNYDSFLPDNEINITVTAKNKHTLFDCASTLAIVMLHKKTNIDSGGESSEEEKGACVNNDTTLPPTAKVSSKSFTESSETLFHCKICNQNFIDVSYFRRHKCVSRQYFLETCDICGKGFNDKSALNVHKKVVHQDIIMEENKLSITICEICGKKLRSSYHLDKHKKLHTKVKNKEKQRKRVGHACEVCSAVCSNRKSLRLHLRTHIATERDEKSKLLLENPGSLTCDVCKQLFNSRSELIKHWRAHATENGVEVPLENTAEELEVRDETIEVNGTPNSSELSDNKFTCEICFKTFDKGYKNMHMILHKGHANCVCSVCNKKFTTSSNLYAHIAQDHCSQTQHCPICKKKFSNSKGVQEHVRVHSNFRPYRCVHCFAAFRTRAAVVQHSLLHSAAKKLKCPFCPKYFKNKVALNTHKSTHTKPHHCAECNRGFAVVSQLRQHMRFHEEGNNYLKYECSICGASYAREFGLKRHLKTHSNDDPQPFDFVKIPIDSSSIAMDK